MGSIFQLLWEAMKFYKIKASRVLQVCFLILFAFHFYAGISPRADFDFTPFLEASQTMMAPEKALEAITPGNWIALILQIVLYFLAAFFALHYALSFAFEHRCVSLLQSEDSVDAFIISLQTAYHEMQIRREALQQRQKGWVKAKYHRELKREGEGSHLLQTEMDESAKKKTAGIDISSHILPLPHNVSAARFAARQMLRKAPGLFLFYILAFILLMMSLPLLFLPFVIAASFYCFAPLNHAAENMSFVSSCRLSRIRGIGFKGFLGTILLLVLLVFNLPQLLIDSLFSSNPYSLRLCQSLLFTFKTFILARLWGIAYLTFAAPCKMEAIPCSDL